MLIRDATETDLRRLLAILNEAIADTTARWTETPETPATVRAWVEACRERGLPVIVAERDGVVAGFGSLAPFRAYSGFRHTVEHSLYVDPAAKRRGVGRALLAALEERARAGGLHTMVGLIGADNEGSLALHRAAGFVEMGRLRELGFKFGPLARSRGHAEDAVTLRLAACACPCCLQPLSPRHVQQSRFAALPSSYSISTARSSTVLPISSAR